MTDRRSKAKTRSRPEKTSGRPEAVSIRLLGGFRVSVGPRVVKEDAWRLKKAASVVKLLALAPNHRLHREQLMEALWPGLSPKAASNNLRGALHLARRILEPDSTTASGCLRLREAQVVLCLEESNLWVDVDAFEAAAATARRTREPAAYRAAIDLYTGELLPQDRYEVWAEERRGELRRLYLSLLVGLAEHCEERGELEPAIEALSRAVAQEPTHEEAHVGLMRLYAASGRRHEAIVQYQQLRNALFERLGVEPGETARLLYEQILAGRSPGRLRSEDHALVVPQEARRHNLPAPRTSFVGREEEIVEIERLLYMTRLLTLTGAGGSGKTRIALEVAKNLIRTYPDGVWLVELASLSEGELVPQAVAQALGVREEPGRPMSATLKDHLSERKLLLVLDNCEHLIEAAALLVEMLLDSCEGLRILATSREALNVSGELIWLVASLSVPDLSGLPAVEKLAGYESVRLFMERARYHDPAFALTPENARAVAEICRRLDGIPLAIELAAARVGVLSVEQIAARLEDSLKLLLTGARTAPPRQRTLKGALDWSYELLSEPERKLFARLSMFAGGWTVEAAEVVGAGDGIEKEQVLELLLRLVEKSLVVVEMSGEGEPRYRMLEPVRQYGQERLEESGMGEEIRRLHASWFLVLAEEAAPEIRGPEQKVWLERLETELDNLRAATANLLRRGELEEVVRFGWALWLFWWINGHLTEGRRWMEEILARNASMPAATRAKALFVAGTMADLQADRRSAEPLLEESLALFRKIGDKRGAAFALGSAGLVALGQERHEEGVALLEEGADLFLQVGDRWGVAVLTLFSGVGWLRRGDLTRAKRLAEQGLALSREIGYRIGVSVTLYTLARVAQAEDDHERATGLFEEVLKLSVEEGNEPLVAYCLEGLAGVAGAEGKEMRAGRLWGAAEALLETIEAAAEAAAYPYAPDRSIYQGQVNAVRARVNEEAFTAAWSEGRAMTTEQAIEYALSGEEEPPTTAPDRQSADKQPTEALTRREQEVAMLVARELTNRQIAEELVISEHTAATHVRKILKKLGLRSRTQIAAWVAEGQSLSEDPG